VIHNAGCGRFDAPDQAEQILLRQTRGRGRLAQRQQDGFAVQRERHDRQRDQQRCPKPGSQRAPHLARIAGAEGLGCERRHRRYQSHSDGEADKVDGARQRRRGDGFVAESPDEGQIGCHHRDLAQLRQRHRHRQSERLGQFMAETVGRAHCLDFVEGGHEGVLAPLPAKSVSLTS